MEVKDIPRIKKVEEVWQVNYAETFLLGRQFRPSRKDDVATLGRHICRKARWFLPIYCWITFTNLYEKTILTRQFSMLKKAWSTLIKWKAELNFTINFRNCIKIKRICIGFPVQRFSHCNQRFDFRFDKQWAFETNKVKLKVQQYQNELKTNIEKERQNEIFL